MNGRLQVFTEYADSKLYRANAVLNRLHTDIEFSFNPGEAVHHDLH